MTKKFLFVLHEMGTLDHAVALRKQILEAGGTVHHVIIRSNQIPPWAELFFPDANRVSERDALENLRLYNAVWLQEPYEELRPIEWRELWEKGRVVYSGYGLTLSNWKQGSFEFPFYDNCDLILAGGPIDEKEHYAAGRGLRNVAVTGDPLMFEVAKLQTQTPSGHSYEKILWAPHWTQRWVDGSRGFATWEWVVRSLYLFFKRYSSANLVVRPHPHLNFRDGNLHSRIVARKLFALPNVSFSRASMLNDISNADVLLSDGVSILGYFGMTGKPVVVIQNEKYESPFSKLGQDIVAEMKNVRTRHELATVLESFPSGKIVGLPAADYVREIISREFIVAEMSPGRFLVDNS